MFHIRDVVGERAGLSHRPSIPSLLLHGTTLPFEGCGVNHTPSTQRYGEVRVVRAGALSERAQHPKSSMTRDSTS